MQQTQRQVKEEVVGLKLAGARIGNPYFTKYFVKEWAQPPQFYTFILALNLSDPRLRDKVEFNSTEGVGLTV
jgi:hypothetical protein